MQQSIFARKEAVSGKSSPFTASKQLRSTRRRSWFGTSREFPKTHDIAKLLDRVATVNAKLAESLRNTDVVFAYASSNVSTTCITRCPDPCSRGSHARCPVSY